MSPERKQTVYQNNTSRKICKEKCEIFLGKHSDKISPKIRIDFLCVTPPKITYLLIISLDMPMSKAKKVTKGNAPMIHIFIKQIPMHIFSPINLLSLLTQYLEIVLKRPMDKCVEIPEFFKWRQAPFHTVSNSPFFVQIFKNRKKYIFVRYF